MTADLENNLIQKTLDRVPSEKERLDITTSIAPNGDFVVHNRGHIIGRLLKGSNLLMTIDDVKRYELHNNHFGSGVTVQYLDDTVETFYIEDITKVSCDHTNDILEVITK